MDKSKIFQKKYIFLILIILFIIIFIHFFKKSETEILYENEYNYFTTKKTNILGSIELEGKISANNPIGIFVDKKLKVREVNVKEGDFVKRDDILVTFDDDEKNKIIRNIEKESLNKNKIKRKLDSSKELYEIGGISLEEVKDLENEYKISKLNLEELNENLSKTAKEIKSPVSGIVSKLKAQKNYLVDTDAPLMEIIDSEDLKIIVEIPEYYSKLVKLGQEADIILENSDDLKFSGKIEKISKISSTSEISSENVLRAEIKINKYTDELIPGFKIRANILLKSNTKDIVIPKNSIIFENDKYYIFKVKKENSVKKEEIKIKNIPSDNVIVTDGLKENEKIVLDPDSRLKDGIKLEKGEEIANQNK